MKYLFTALIVLTCDFAYAQSNYGFTEATIVYKRGDSMLCVIKREPGYGEVITYKIRQGADESQVGSSYIKSIRIGSAYIENVPLGKKEKLAIVVLTGKLSLFTYVEMETGEAEKVANVPGARVAGIKTTVHYIIKTGENYTEVKERSFEKDLKRLLADCPAIITNLEDHDFVFADIPSIIRQYNSCKN